MSQIKLIDRIKFAFNVLSQKQAVWQDIGVLGGWQHTGGISRTANYTELINSYRGWVYACISIIARNVAKVPLKLYEQDGDDLIRIDDHVLAELLDYINPIHTKYELWYNSINWLDLTGNTYWYTPQNGLGVPGEIWPIPPDRMEVVPDPKELIKGYLYRYQEKTVAFDKEEIIHLRYPNPKNMYYGMGTLQAATYEYDTDLYMKQYSVNLFKNDARPTGVLMTDQTVFSDTLDRVRMEWKKAYGGINPEHKVAVLQAGLKYEPIQITPNELDYLASRRASRDELLGIFGVPASKLGLVEDVNRANAEMNDYTFQSEVIRPRLKLIEAVLNKFLVTKFDDRLKVQFDNPVPKDKKFELEKQELHLKNFVRDVNEVRSEEGFEPSEWGDGPFIPFNLVKYGQEPFGAASYEQVEEEKNSLELNGPSPDEELQSPEQKDRDVLWRQFLALHFPLQEHFRRALKPLFNAQRDEVLKNLEKALKAVSDHQSGIDQKYDPALIDFILFSQLEWEQKFATMAGPEILAMLKAGVEKALADIAAGEFEFDYRHPKVTAFINKRKQRFSFEVNDTTLKQLKAELIAGLEAGEAIEVLAARVNKVFDFSESWRALRIARTETTIALNTGIIQAYTQTGLVKMKMWITARDENVRSSHFVMDGVKVELDSKFQMPSGELLDYPGDPNGSAGEIINCRGTILPIIDNED